jgi:hypothetical protein
VTLAQYLKIAQPLTTRIPPPPQTNTKTSRKSLYSIYTEISKELCFGMMAYMSTLHLFLREGCHRMKLAASWCAKRQWLKLRWCEERQCPATRFPAHTKFDWSHPHPHPLHLGGLANRLCIGRILLRNRFAIVIRTHCTFCKHYWFRNCNMYVDTYAVLQILCR